MKIFPSTSELLGGLLTVKWPRRGVAMWAQRRPGVGTIPPLGFSVNISLLEICHCWELWPGGPSAVSPDMKAGPPPLPPAGSM